MGIFKVFFFGEDRLLDSGFLIADMRPLRVGLRTKGDRIPRLTFFLLATIKPDFLISELTFWELSPDLLFNFRIRVDRSSPVKLFKGSVSVWF